MVKKVQYCRILHPSFPGNPKRVKYRILFLAFQAKIVWNRVDLVFIRDLMLFYIHDIFKKKDIVKDIQLSQSISEKMEGFYDMFRNENATSSWRQEFSRACLKQKLDQDFYIQVYRKVFDFVFKMKLIEIRVQS